MPEPSPGTVLTKHSQPRDNPTPEAFAFDTPQRVIDSSQLGYAREELITGVQSVCIGLHRKKRKGKEEGR